MKLDPGAPQGIIQQILEARKGLIKGTTLFFMIAIGIMLPSTFFIPNHYVWLFVIIVEMFCIGALLLNASGRLLVAGIVVVTSFELAIFGVILTTQPFEVLNLRLYDLFIIGELLAATLLPPKSAWAVLGTNLTFMLYHICFGAHSALLASMLRTQSYNVWAIPAGLQVVVTGAIYFWVRHVNQLVHHYYRDFQHLRLQVKAMTKGQHQLEQLETPAESEPPKKQV